MLIISSGEGDRGDEGYEGGLNLTPPAASLPGVGNYWGGGGGN